MNQLRFFQGIGFVLLAGVFTIGCIDTYPNVLTVWTQPGPFAFIIFIALCLIEGIYDVVNAIFKAAPKEQVIKSSFGDRFVSYMLALCVIFVGCCFITTPSFFLIRSIYLLGVGLLLVAVGIFWMVNTVDQGGDENSFFG